ncbi:MAG: radical SAM protein [Archaeoglobus sp.]|uniref:radical SAM/SPASM domain-containing protein n=1 Tax=Archaeoglobus sp. TaxID=1872626 RepID=UPI001D50CE60|nr:radical SAM/SPASM domain-containing protein [Archaeoglobus sp.]MBO8179140.1 radical SAM protein [Archaeoglobus sp.]
MRLKKLQIEPTTFCTLDCEYCHRKNVTPGDLPLEVLEKVEGVAKEYVIYGYGEPLLYPEFFRKIEGFNGKIIISTNGMLDSEILDVVDKVGVSIDVNDKFRKGLEVDRAIGLLKKLGERAIAEVVVTRQNLELLPQFFERIAEFGAGMLATNVVASNPAIYEQGVYFEGSRITVEEVLGLDESILVEAIRDCSRGGGESLRRYKHLLKDIYSKGYSINLLSIFGRKDRIETAFRAEDVFERLRETAREYGVELIEPSFFGDSKARECPYKNSAFLRVDGSISSCMTFAYTHNEYVNEHYKKIEEYTVGNVLREDVDDVIEKMSKFEKLREDMENFPWCADCPYVEGCWYAETNVDCYANQPSCSECLYSSRIARCLLGD